MAALNTHNAFHEIMRSTLEKLYSRESADILGAVGSDN